MLSCIKILTFDLGFSECTECRMSRLVVYALLVAVAMLFAEDSAASPQILAVKKK